MYEVECKASRETVKRLATDVDREQTLSASRTNELNSNRQVSFQINNAIKHTTVATQASFYGESDKTCAEYSWVIIIHYRSKVWNHQDFSKTAFI